MYGGSARELPYMALPAAFLTDESSTGCHFYINIARNLHMHCRKSVKSKNKRLEMNWFSSKMQYDRLYHSYVKMIQNTANLMISSKNQEKQAHKARTYP